MANGADSSNIKNGGLPILGTGVREKDPVCGMTVDPSKAAAKQEFQGNTYYFCSKRCAERFAKEPEKFLAAPGTSGMAPHSGGGAQHCDRARRGAVAGPRSTVIPLVARRPLEVRSLGKRRPRCKVALKPIKSPPRNPRITP